MKFRILSLAVVLGLLAGLMALPVAAQDGEPPTPEEIEESIEKGLEWLVARQDPVEGSWPGWEEEKVAKTGFAVVKLEERAFELDFESPFDPEYIYSSNVEAGLDYIFSKAGVSACCPNPDPANPEMICFSPGWTENYSTGIAMMAIAASRAPERMVNVPGSIVNGWSYKAVVEANVAYFECAQNDDGGWRYQCGDPDSDNSNTGYSVLGLSYAKVFGCDIPEGLIANLSAWIDTIQDDVDHDPPSGDDGGSWYMVNWAWVNLLKTGNLLSEMALAGDPPEPESERLTAAIGYIERHWDAPGGDEMGYPWWRGNYQAMYCLMKGLAAYGIETITVVRDGEPVEVNWFDEMAAEILTWQHDDGFWPPDWWGDEILTTEWALLTLEAVIPDVVPPVVECTESVNPHGNNIPGGKAQGKGTGINPDGFYLLFAKDNRDENPQIWVGTDCETMLFGPFYSGDIVKLTEAPGAIPSCKKIGSSKGQANAVITHITLPSDAVIKAIDASGNESKCTTCFVPPPPK